MPRTRTCLVAIFLCGTAFAPDAASSAPRPGMARAAPFLLRPAPRAAVRHESRAVRLQAFARGPYRARWGLGGGPGYWPFGAESPAPAPVIVQLPDGLPAAGERSFANLPARTGIPYPPRPEPTIYRIEGSRSRPVARVIRLSDPEPAGSVRTRYVHAETGALLLTVPRR